MIGENLKGRFMSDKVNFNPAPFNMLTMSGYEQMRSRIPFEFRKENMELTISQVTNGWLVRAGCFTLVFEDPVRLGVELVRYLNEPDKVFAEYQKKYSRNVDGPLAMEGSALADEGLYRNMVGERAKLNATSRLP